MELQNTIHTHVLKKKKTPGWTTINCPMCTTHWTTPRPDTRPVVLGL